MYTINLVSITFGSLDVLLRHVELWIFEGPHMLFYHHAIMHVQCSNEFRTYEHAPGASMQ